MDEQKIAQPIVPPDGAATPEEAVQRDLERERDARCAPVVAGILNDFVTDLLPLDANLQVNLGPVTGKILQRSLDADLVVSTDTAYVFQLILGVFEALSTVAQQCVTVVKTDEARYASIGRKILALVAGANLVVTGKPAEISAALEAVKPQLNELLKEEQLNDMELRHVMMSIFDSFKAVNNLFLGSIEMSTKRAEAKLFGIDDMDALTMKQLDAVLKSDNKPADPVA